MDALIIEAVLGWFLMGGVLGAVVALHLVRRGG